MARRTKARLLKAERLKVIRQALIVKRREALEKGLQNTPTNAPWTWNKKSDKKRKLSTWQRIRAGKVKPKAPITKSEKEKAAAAKKEEKAKIAAAAVKKMQKGGAQKKTQRKKDSAAQQKGLRVKESNIAPVMPVPPYLMMYGQVQEWTFVNVFAPQ